MKAPPTPDDLTGPTVPGRVLREAALSASQTEPVPVSSLSGDDQPRVLGALPKPGRIVMESELVGRLRFTNWEFRGPQAMVSAMGDAATELERLAALVEKLQACLDYYADGSIYQREYGGWSDAEIDGGRRARATLAKLSSQTPRDAE